MKKIIIFVLIPAFFIQVIGCYSESVISKESLSEEKDEDIRIITYEGKEYEGESHNWFVKKDTLTINSYNNEQKIPLTSIEEVYANQLDVGETIGGTVFITLLAGTLIFIVTRVVHDYNQPL